MDEFSSLKPAWHLDRLRDLRHGRSVVPTHLQLIISDLCNQDCHFCAYRMSGGFSTEHFADEKGNKNPKRFIPYPKVEEILLDANALGVKAIEFTGGGEPTVHPHWRKCIQKALDLGFEVGLVTNGVRLHTEDDDMLRRLKWIRISLDSATPETYEKIRASKAWKQAMNGVAVAVNAGQFFGPLVGVGFVITQENYREIVSACQLAAGYGVPYIRFSAMFSHLGSEYYSKYMQYKIHRQLKYVKEYFADKSFKIVDFFDNRVNDLAQKAPDYPFCGYQQFVLYIGGDQKIYTCCTNAYTSHGEIGDLRNQSFIKWMQTDGQKRFGFNAFSCHHCQFNDKNRLIQWLVRGEPEHVNFV